MGYSSAYAMKALLKKRLIVVIVLAFGAAFTLLAILPVVFVDYLHDNPSLRRKSTQRWLERIGYWSRIGAEKSGRWAESLDELMQQLALGTNGVEFGTDRWHQSPVYVPYDTSRGYGTVISYGKDGKPGGKGEDADIEVRFDAHTPQPKGQL